MCRWLAYSGPPILLSSLILAPENSLIRQSRAALQGASSTNGDGFGIGWDDRHRHSGDLGGGDQVIVGAGGNPYTNRCTPAHHAVGRGTG